MTSIKTLLALSVGALALSAGSMAQAQTPYGGSSQQPAQQPEGNRVLEGILGALFGTGQTTLDSEWSRGRRPLFNQRATFESRLDTGVRDGSLSYGQSTRLRSDYAELVELETRFAGDGRFTTAERADLNARYRDLTQRLEKGDDYGNDGDGGYGSGGYTSVAGGRVEFDGRVDTAVRNRRITRAQGTRLKADYQALIQVESGYLRDGSLNARERDDLETRLDALDARVGDVGYGGGNTIQTPRARLDAIARALPSSGLSTMLQTQLRVEHEDLMRLDAAYSRYSASADDRAYLDRRIGELEVRARMRR